MIAQWIRSFEMQQVPLNFFLSFYKWIVVNEKYSWMLSHRKSELNDWEKCRLHTKSFEMYVFTFKLSLRLIVMDIIGSSIHSHRFKNAKCKVQMYTFWNTPERIWNERHLCTLHSPNTIYRCAPHFICKARPLQIGTSSRVDHVAWSYLSSLKFSSFNVVMGYGFSEMYDILGIIRIEVRSVPFGFVIIYTIWPTDSWTVCRHIVFLCSYF